MARIAPSAPIAYWLQGEEHCPHCLLAYHVAVERRCTFCDGPACPHCVDVVKVEGEVICPSCALAPEHDPSPEQNG